MGQSQIFKMSSLGAPVFPRCDLYHVLLGSALSKSRPLSLDKKITNENYKTLLFLIGTNRIYFVEIYGLL